MEKPPWVTLRIIVVVVMAGSGYGLYKHWGDGLAIITWLICMAIAFAGLFVIDWGLHRRHVVADWELCKRPQPAVKQGNMEGGIAVILLRFIFGLFGVALAYYGGREVWLMTQPNDTWSTPLALGYVVLVWAGFVFITAAFGREKGDDER